MPRTGRIIILTFLLCIIFSLARPALAALDLEQVYPGVSSDQEVTLTGKTSLMGAVKYYSTWAIVIAALAAVVSLIVGGFQYLTSAGRPQAMSDARKHITRSLLGLAILATSYLVLKIANPQINLLTIRKVPVTSGIVALTKRALEGDLCQAPSDPCDGDNGAQPLEGRGLMSSQPAPLKELVELGQARYLPYNVPDMTGAGGFGRMIIVEYDSSNNPRKLNFEDFPLYAIGFWGEDSQNIKVKTYSEKGLGAFGGTVSEYTIDGKVDWDWTVQRPSSRGGADPSLDIIILEDDFVTSPVDFIDPKAKPPDPSQYSKTDAPALPHPPLSMTMEGIGPGVYLYSDISQRYFPAGSSDLLLSDFDDKAAKIEIKNTNPRPDALDEKHNYLAILYDDAQRKGSLRMFFQQETLAFMSQVYLQEDDFYQDVTLGSDPAPTVDLDALKADSNLWSDSLSGGIDYFRGVYLLARNYEAGNVPVSDPANPAASRIDVNAMDQYGKVNGASSIQVFEIAKRSACKEVRLCNEKFGQGYCISYTDLGRLAKGLYNAFNLPMPWYAPVNLPAIVEGTVQIRDENVPSPDVTLEELTFKRNILSIVIDGNCLVALFKNPVEDLRACLNGTLGECWKNDTPEAKSQVFTQSDMDLTDDPIGTCSARDVGRFGIGKVGPCAAAIAVFPIK